MQRPVILIIFTALVISLTVPYQPGAVGRESDALERPCADIELILARGSGQETGTTGETGGSRELRVFRLKLQEYIGPDLTLNAYELGTESPGGYQYPR